MEQLAADEVFNGTDIVIDVHTHFMGSHPGLKPVGAQQLNSYRRMAPDWWTGLDGVEFYSFAE